VACPTKRTGYVDAGQHYYDEFQIVRRRLLFIANCYIKSTYLRCRAAVSESSYLPFLFHAEDMVTPSFNGRRSFVKGKEIPVCFTFFSYSALCDHATNPRFSFNRQRLRSSPSRRNHQILHNQLIPNSSRTPCREGLALVVFTMANL